MLKRADKMLLMPDLFNYFLTGEKKAEYSIASTTQLLDAKARNWSEAVSYTHLDVYKRQRLIFRYSQEK